MSAAEHCYGKVVRLFGGTIPVISVLEFQGNFIFTTAFAEMFNIGRAAIRVEDGRVFLEIPLLNETVEIVSSARDREEIVAMLADTTVEWRAVAFPYKVDIMSLVVAQRR